MSCLVNFATPKQPKSESETTQTQKWVNPITEFTHFCVFISTAENPYEVSR